MRTRLVVYSTFAATLIMLGINTKGRGEKLAVADGKPSASELPLDRESSQVAFQTATFGLG